MTEEEVSYQLVPFYYSFVVVRLRLTKSYDNKVSEYEISEYEIRNLDTPRNWVW